MKPNAASYLIDQKTEQPQFQRSSRGGAENAPREEFCRFESYLRNDQHTAFAEQTDLRFLIPNVFTNICRKNVFCTKYLLLQNYN